MSQLSKRTGGGPLEPPERAHLHLQVAARCLKLWTAALQAQQPSRFKLTGAVCALSKRTTMKRFPEPEEPLFAICWLMWTLL